MAVKLQLRNSLLTRFLFSRWGRTFVVISMVALAVGVGIFTYYYVKYGRLIEEKLAAGPFASTSLLYAAPRPVMSASSKWPRDYSVSRAPPRF